MRYHAVMSGGDIDWAVQDWDDLVPRLLLLAVSRLYRMTWRGRRGEAPPGAAEAEDYVNDAISKTISGVRVWNPGNCTLFQHLAGVIVSDVSHAATSTENRTTMAPPDDPPGDRWPPDPADDCAGSGTGGRMEIRTAPPAGASAGDRPRARRHGGADAGP